MGEGEGHVEEGRDATMSSDTTTVNIETTTIIAEGTGGPRGVPGSQGDPGDPGIQGNPGVVQSIVEGPGIDVDATDPANPIVSATGGGGGGELVDGDYGDVTVSGTGTAMTVDNNVINNAKLADMAQATIKGRQAGGGTGDPEDLTAAQARTAMGLGTAALSATGAFDPAGSAAAAQAASQPLDTDLTNISALATLAYGRSLLTLADAAAGRTSLGLVIGTNVQAFSSVLAATTASFLTADETKLDGIEALADVTDAANVDAAGGVMESDYNANTVLAATADNTPLPLTMGASTLLARLATGDIVAASTSQIRTLLGLVIGTDVQAFSSVLQATTASFLVADETKLDGIEALADVTDATNVNAAGAVMESDYDANTVLAATADNTPLPITMGASTMLARLASGDIVAASTTQIRTLLGLVIGTNVQAWDADLDSLAAVGLTAAGLALLDDANAAAQRTTLGLAIGTNVQAWDADLDSLAGLGITAAGLALLDDANAAAQRTTLGLVIGTDVQAFSSTLATLASATAAGLALMDDADASAQRTTLGLGTMAVQNASGVAVTGGTLVGLTSVVIQGATPELAGSALDVDGAGGVPIHASGGISGLQFIGTGFSASAGRFDGRSTRAPSLAALAIGNTSYHTLSGDTLTALHAGGSHDAALVDSAVIEAIATENFSGATATASGTRWDHQVTANGTETKFIGMRVDQDGSVDAYRGLVVGEIAVPFSAVNQIEARAFGATPTQVLMHAAGTRSAKTKTLSGTNIGSYAWKGFEETTPGYAGNSARISAFALEDFTSTALGSRIGMFVVAPTTTTQLEAIRIMGATVTQVMVNGQLQVGGTGHSAFIVSQPSTAGFQVLAGSSLFADGTVSNPGLSFTSDPDTGIYWVSANQFAFATAGVQRLLLSTTTLTFADAMNIAFNTTTGTKIGTATTQKIGFYNATPIVQPSAYTQTFSTADKTHAARTSTGLSMSVGTADGTIADVGAAFSQTTLNNNFRDVGTEINAVRADLADTAALVNSIIDDLQAIGLAG